MIGPLRGWLHDESDGERDDPPALPEVDTAFELLRNERRRRTIEAVTRLDDGDGVRLGELARHIAHAETTAATPADVTTTQRKRVYIALYQSHIPKLDDADVVHAERDTLYATDASVFLSDFLDDFRDIAGGGVDE